MVECERRDLTELECAYSGAFFFSTYSSLLMAAASMLARGALAGQVTDTSVPVTESIAVTLA